MKKVERSELVDFATYEDLRKDFRGRVLQAKVPRRIHLGSDLTLLFENALTVRYQVQEMMRTERIVREADIRHELDTYNEILGGDGELGATLLIEIEDPAERKAKLAQWLALPDHLYLGLEDGTRVRARSDLRQRGDEALSAVQYVKFDVASRVPVAAGVDLPGLVVATRLATAERRALAEDLGVTLP